MVAAKNWCTSKIFGVCVGILGVVSIASLAYKGFISDPYFIAFLSLAFISLIFGPENLKKYLEPVINLFKSIKDIFSDTDTRK